MNSQEDIILSKQIISAGQKSNGGKTLILLETEAQVKDCLAWLDDVAGEKIIIALTPFAMYELDKKNIHYKVVQEYYATEDLYKLGIYNFKKVEELCKVIDDFIPKTNGKLNEYRITPALFNFYYLKIIYDAITIRLFQLNKLIKCEKPDALVIYEGKKYPFGALENAPYLFFDNRESIYSQLLSLEGWETRVIKKPNIQESSDEFIIKEKNYSIYLMKKFKKLVTLNSLISDFAVVFKKNGFLGLSKYLKNIILTDKKTPVIIFGAGYNWDDCLEDLQNLGITPVYRISENFRWLNKSLQSNAQPLAIVLENLKTEKEFNKFFKEANVDFLPVLESRILFLIEKLTLACIFAYEDFIRLIIDKEIKAVISSTISTPEGHTIARAAHNAGIPVVTWQHGGYGEMDHPLLIYTELISSDAHFVFGDGVRKYMEPPAKVLGTRLVTIGSSSLAKIENNLIEQRQSPKKVILYVTSAIMQNYSNISTFPPFEDNHLWHTQKAIINILGKYKELNIIVKQHPTNVIKDTPFRSYVIDKGFNNFSFIKQERSLVELISVSDAVVIDLPMTTILQVLTTSKPLFVYLGHVHYDENACYLLGRRAIYDKDITGFINKLDEYLSTKIYKADVNNKEFLMNYGTTYLEGYPGMRAAGALKQVINEFNKSNI